MAKKGGAEKVRMESTGTMKDGRPTGFRYYKKRTRNLTEKMSFRKYDPCAWNPETGKCGMHVDFVEKKMPPSKKN